MIQTRHIFHRSALASYRLGVPSSIRCLSNGTSSHGIVFSDEVLQAKDKGRPIVALESTIISHGMPYPQNLQTALDVEQRVRNHGATPATIAILSGNIHVGLSKEEIEKLARLDDVKKCSTRDLPFIISQGGNGATTVARYDTNRF